MNGKDMQHHMLDLDVLAPFKLALSTNVTVVATRLHSIPYQFINSSTQKCVFLKSSSTTNMERSNFIYIVFFGPESRQYEICDGIESLSYKKTFRL